MKDFGSWFAEQGESKANDDDGLAYMKCRGCAKTEAVDLKSYYNGDTGWYVEEEVEPDEDYEGVCGGSQFCLP